MSKLWLIARREYLFNLKRPAFLFAMFGTPLIIIGSAFLGGLAASDGVSALSDYGLVGYVDDSSAQVLAADLIPADYAGDFQRYPDVDAAAAALEAAEVEAYFVLGQDYLNSGLVTFYAVRAVPELLRDAVNELLVLNLSQGLNSPVPLERISGSPADLTVRSAEDGREIRGELGGFIVLLLPVFFGFLLIMSSLTTSGFLLSGLVEEKSGRVIELLVTSMTPMQLLGGKVLGLGLLGLTQVVVLLGLTAIGLITLSGAGIVEGLALPIDMAFWALLFFLLSYGMLASLMAGIGAMTDTEQEGRQISGFITLPFILPYIFFIVFLTDPNGTLPVVLSLIPITAPMSMMIRLGVGAVPAWQLLLSTALQILTILFFVWVSARMFRWGMLRYGKKFRLRDIPKALRFGTAQHDPALSPSSPEEVVRT